MKVTGHLHAIGGRRCSIFRNHQLCRLPNGRGSRETARPRQVVNRVGVHAIHLAACMLALCPFKNKYLRILREKFPGIEFVEGTHKEPPGVTPEMFVEAMKGMLTQPQQTMADVAKTITRQMSADEKS